MDIYSYKIITSPTEIGEPKLNALGRRGYELCGVVSNDFGYMYYFKKKSE